MSHPNQKSIIVKKKNLTKDDLYSKFGKEATFRAMKNLTHKSFMLWSYFNLNANNYKFILYMDNVVKQTSLSESSYRRSFQELIDKGYIIANHGNIYNFYEDSLLDNKIKTNTVVIKDSFFIGAEGLKVQTEDYNNFVYVSNIKSKNKSEFSAEIQNTHSHKITNVRINKSATERYGEILESDILEITEHISSEGILYIISYNIYDVNKNKIDRIKGE